MATRTSLLLRSPGGAPAALSDASSRHNPCHDRSSNEGRTSSHDRRSQSGLTQSQPGITAPDGSA
jgi:hypothetical protein